MKWFHSSYAIRSRFYLKLTMVNLNESRKDRELEGSNQHHAKALGERPTSGAGRPRIARPACTCGRSLWPFYRCAGSVCNAPGKLLRSIGWKVQAGLNSLWNSFEFLWNVSSVLLVWTHCTLSERSEQGCGWHTQVHQPQEHKKEQLFIFILCKTKWGAAVYNWMN